MIRDIPNALILDFFAGSGTTLHAVNLLNAIDGGHRRCILVTNNEVSEEEAKDLSKAQLHPGDAEWEKHGICQSVTWPRSKYTINGSHDNGKPLEGEYLTGIYSARERARVFHQIGYISIKDLNTITKKKQLVSLINDIPQSEIKNDTAFIATPKHAASILFDDNKIEEWLAELEDKEHITDFYIVTEARAIFNDIKNRIIDLLGSTFASEEEKLPMKNGFKANLEYFRLDFLDKDDVALGRQIREILPLLWLKAGAIGPRPELQKRGKIPDMLIPKLNSFAVLLDEKCFAKFTKQLAKRDNISHVFLVTDSEEAFHDMAMNIHVANIYQLYRDYMENFMINRGEEA